MIIYAEKLGSFKLIKFESHGLSLENCHHHRSYETETLELPLLPSVEIVVQSSAL